MAKRCPRFTCTLVRSGSIPYEIEGNGRILSSREAERIIGRIVRTEMENAPHEIFGIITLDTKHRPIGYVAVTTGVLDASLVHPREVFRPAIIQNASAIICVHNHPSGDLTPSREDRLVFDRLKRAGDEVGINCLDAIIVGFDDETAEWKSESLREA